MLVEAAAGGGKTRLLSEFAGEARDAGAVVLAGRCLQDGVVPFAPFTEALRRIAGDPLPAWVVDELTRLLPELGPAGSAPAGSPEDARHRLLEAVAAAIGETARRGPVLLVIEDLHWADAATVAMLGHVVRTVGWAPLLVAGSRRDDESGEAALGDLLDELGRAHRLERVAVPGLSAQEAGRLAGAWLRAEPARALADVLHRRTGGNPLFVEALARHLVESHPEDGADLAAAAGTEVPEGVRAVIDRRLARLPADAVGAVRLGAVAGEDFLLDDVARAGAVDDEATAEALEAAVAAGLVDAGGGPARYRFAHALVREAVLAGLSSTRRALLHRRMADALAERPDRLPERARHLLDARPLADADVAARAALAAAALATQGLAYEDAAALLGRALEAGLAGHEPLRLELLLALGDARLRLGDGDGARTAFADAATLARARGDADALARAALGTTGIGVRVGPVRPEVQAALEEALAAVADDAPLRPVLLARLAIELYHVPPAGRREALSAEALAGGRRAGGRALLEALGARHVALWSPAHTEERLAIAGELISAARAAGDREAELQGLNWRVVDLYELGELEALRATAAEHERLADALRLPAYAFFAPMWRASLALLAGRQHEAERLHAGGAELARLARDDNARLLLETQRLSLHASGGGFAADDAEIVLRRLETSRARAGWLVALTIHRYTAGDRAAARDAFTAGVAAFADTEPDANWLYSATGLGVLAERFGDRDAADLLYRALAPYGHRIVTIARGSYCTGSAQLALGMLAIARADRAAAAAHLEAAIRANDALGAPRLRGGGAVGAGRPDRRTPSAPPRCGRRRGSRATRSAGRSRTRWSGGSDARIHAGLTLASRAAGTVVVRPSTRSLPVSLHVSPHPLAERFSGELITPDHPSYDAARRVWNGMIDRFPAVIARCANAADVAAAVRYAGEHDLALAVRGGGHNVAGTAVVDDGLVIDLAPLRGVRIDAARRTVRVEGGATWADVDAVTAPLGLATPGGVVSETGVAGLALSGGVSSQRRLHGMTIDNLVAAELVLADGRLVRASADEHPDLFWAIRGGGGNFGVVTAFELRLHPLGPEVFSINVAYPIADAARVLAAWRDAVADAPDELSSAAFTWSLPVAPELPEHLRGADYVGIDGMWAGDPEEGERATRHLRELATPLLDMSGAVGYLDQQRSLDPYFPAGLRYYWKALYLDALPRARDRRGRAPHRHPALRRAA